VPKGAEVSRRSQFVDKQVFLHYSLQLISLQRGMC